MSKHYDSESKDQYKLTVLFSDGGSLVERTSSWSYCLDRFEAIKQNRDNDSSSTIVKLQIEG